MAVLRSAVFAVLCVLACPSGAAALNADPIALSVGETARGQLSASSPLLADQARHVCYAIDPPAGAPVTVTMRSRTLDSRLWLVRGAQCPTGRMLDENDTFEAGSRDARLTFTPAGGRYLIVARAADPAAQGDFVLTSQTARSSTPSPTTGGVVARPQTAPGSPAPAETDREALMLAQTQVYQEQQAAEQRRLNAEAAQRRREAAEAQERREAEARSRREAFTGFLGVLAQGAVAVADGYNQGLTEDRYAADSAAMMENIRSNVESQQARQDEERRRAEASRRTRQEWADNQARADAQGAAETRAFQAAEAERVETEHRQLREAEARRVAEQQRRDAERQAEQRRQEEQRRVAAEQAAAREAERNRLIDFPEVVVLCALEGGQARFGNYTCYGGLQTVTAKLDTPGAAVPLGQACGGAPPAELGTAGMYRAFGCGFGMVNGGTGAYRDPASRLGVTFVPGRTIFRCSARQAANSCRAQ
ncbi:hypothetical protein [Brevundimonas goettingensis]|uniref:Uncharacterized protein n=1 Tax=Brevundimonas goettingensis TaxID=2774190 RepID=A0A975GUI9_9CAUL|nr:hypothetical protein [Brevundimonas goettingensis]QTC90162.1 hypothetical protein IFJ75_12830 [Brevundimonas goettingensis]